MSLRARLSSAYGAFIGSAPAQNAVRLKAPPSAPIGPTGERTHAKVAGWSTAPRKRRRVAPIPQDRQRWLRADIESAEQQANSGQLQRPGQIAQWVKEDLVVGGLMLTRCSVPRLPREWRGDDEAIAWLQGDGPSVGCFDRIHPPVELEELAIDHLDLGVGLGIYVQASDARYPTLVRLDNQYLRYLPGEDRWQYQGWGKVYDVEPGNGVWVMHANGAIDPWRRGIWSSLAYDQVSEDGAGLARDGFIWKYANPLVMAISPTGAADDQKLRFWEGVASFVMGFAGVTPGYDVKLIQPEAKGQQIFKDAEDRAERRAMIRICGQVVTTTGGVGFSNAEIFATIASHLVTRTAQDLCTTLNVHALPHVVRWGAAAGYLSSGAGEVVLKYDTTPPQARKAEAEAIEAAAKAVVAMRAAGFEPDMREVLTRFRLPVKPIEVAAHAPVDPSPPQLPSAQPEEQADAPAKSRAAVLAQGMTEHNLDACHHGFKNSCQWCGIVRTREVVPGVDGAPATWKLGWIAADDPRLTAPGGTA